MSAVWRYKNSARMVDIYWIEDQLACENGKSPMSEEFSIHRSE